LFHKSGLSYVVGDPAFLGTRNSNELEACIDLAQALHKIDCVCPFVYENNPTPVLFAIDPHNPVKAIRVCTTGLLLVQQIYMNLVCTSRAPAEMKKACCKPSLYTPVPIILKKNSRYIELPPPNCSSVYKLEVTRDRNETVNIWFGVWLIPGSMPLPVLPKRERKMRAAARKKMYVIFGSVNH
jgi:hypothetical protein